MEANLEYMLKNFGFYMPDAEYLSDPAGLLRYLVSLSAGRNVIVTTACLCCMQYVSMQYVGCTIVVLFLLCLLCLQCQHVLTSWPPIVCFLMQPLLVAMHGFAYACYGRTGLCIAVTAHTHSWLDNAV